MPATAGTGVTLPGPCEPGRCAGQPPGEPLTLPGLTRCPAVTGDQVATGGAPGRRLGYAFMHYRPHPGTLPPDPADESLRTTAAPAAIHPPQRDAG
jgi:hypothetical protein